MFCGRDLGAGSFLDQVLYWASSLARGGETIIFTLSWNLQAYVPVPLPALIALEVEALLWEGLASPF